MTVSHDVLRFLRHAEDFARDVDPVTADRLDRALNDIVSPAIRCAGDHPLRPAQERAWRGLSHLRAGLVLGPPGTGKTHLLSWLVLGHSWARTVRGDVSRAFLTAFTRSAIETLMASIAKRSHAGPSEPTLVYIGRPRAGSLPSNVRCLPTDRKGWIDELRDLLDRPSVILGGTVWRLYQAIGEGCLPQADGPTAPFFDLVAIDEASQMVLGQGLLGLAGLADAGRVIVAGDDRQLPPIRAARGMVIDGREVGGSLYAFLKGVGVPEFALNETFRLNAPLTSFPERRFYPGTYESAVPDRRLDLRPGWKAGLEDWERVALDPRFPTVVIVHDGPSAATQSPFEVDLTCRLAECLRDRMRTSSGLPFADEAFWAEGLALVSPHRAQNAALRQRLGATGREAAFVETVDRIQGRERDVVLLSYTVSDPEFALAEADFIYSPERLNVTITRARSKLVVIVSRRLLEVVPPQQETLDKSEVLREFAFACPKVGEADIQFAAEAPVRAVIHAGGFSNADAPANTAAIAAPEPRRQASALEPRLRSLLEGIEALRGPAGKWVRLARVASGLSRPGGLVGTFPEVRELHAAGWVSLAQFNDKFTGRPEWLLRPFETARRVYELDDPDFRERVHAVLTGDGIPYWKLRDGFVWMGSSHPGDDLLRPLIEAMVEAGELGSRLSSNGTWMLASAVDRDAAPDDAPQARVSLSDDDFFVLNALEDVEAARIEAGVVEVWSQASDVGDRLHRPVGDVAKSLARLTKAGHVIQAAEGRIRSRMAELARELRHVKQRFGPADAGSRPYLVRSLKVRLRDRVKPVQDVPLSDVLERIKARHCDETVNRALDGLGASLVSLWREPAALAGFQARAFEAISESWLGTGGESTYVIAADTGSGKTEAAVLPIIAGACVDALRGVTGVRATLAYPRVRLAANQSQRLARYLSALAAVRDMPVLTLGVQFADVPESWDMNEARARDAARVGWIKSSDGWRFPLFACPGRSCGGQLEVQPGRGQRGVDRLWCAACGWSYEGWVGTKEGLRAKPPSLFLPTMDSLHQWMQDPRCAGLFGDVDGRTPRAFLADEIHLYAHVHGAQVGYAMRRLLARSEINDPDGRACVAVGMSATLGDPRRSFSRLVGRSQVTLVSPTAAETPVNPRGREYFYFVQPEVESREKDVAGASTTIQSLMCLAHGMRRRRGDGSGFRALAFLDSIDKVRRLHSAFADAEKNRLAALRTTAYDDDPATGRARTSCCGFPATCEVFRDGECWYPAAVDPDQARADHRRWRAGTPLAVARHPVTSGTRTSVEEMIKASDVVFATSSLEVGYDDPDIALVFQHYGPQNLASFVQRKGRGGRGADDRPITAVTLSLYAPRDTYWFHRPDLMLDAAGYEAPLNPENYFVRRAQILCVLLDALAVFQARQKRSPWTSEGISREALSAAAPFVERVFGPTPWTDYDCATLGELWAAALARADTDADVRTARDARSHLPWVPTFLHDTINLPSLKVAVRGVEESAEHDLPLVFGMLAPGNVTRRFHPSLGGWRPPSAGLGPWLADADYETAGFFNPCGPEVADLKAELPDAARDLLGPDLGPAVIRPRQITLEPAGEFAQEGAGWETDLFVDPLGAVQVAQTNGDRARALHHESRAHVDGCIIVRARDGGARDHCDRDRAPQVRRLRVFANAQGGTRGAGLAITEVAWGSEAALKVQAPGVDPVVVRQTFSDPRTGRVALHGFGVLTEGVQIELDGDRIDAFVAQEVASDDAAGWRRLQMARAESLVRLQAIGTSRFDAERLATLVGYLATNATIAKDLDRMKRFPNPKRLGELFREVRDAHLSEDPLLTPRRVLDAAAQVSDRRVTKVLLDAITALDDAAARRRHLRSALLSGLALRWRQMFVLLAQGDERRVNVHVKLPIQYATGASDVITVAEVGQSGDGTTRAFAAAIEQAWTMWSEGFAAGCPNAGEDAALDRFFAARSRHADWLSLNPRDQRRLDDVAEALRGPGDDAKVPASVLGILFSHQVIGREQFRTYDTALAVREARDDLELRLGRMAMPWELASSVTTQASTEQGSPHLVRLLRAFEAMPEVHGEGSLAPRARFADQVYRVGTRLCADGCRACVHQDGGPLRGLLGEATVSRELISRYLAFA